MLHRFLVALLLSLGLSAPALAADETASPLRVVASFSILADLVQQVGGDVVTVTALVGAEQDAHGFSPRPSDAAALAQADLVVVNGLGFEGWITRLVAAANYRGLLLIASKDVTPRALAEEVADDHHGHHHAHDQDHNSAIGAVDPHAWQDPRLVQIYVANIAAALAGLRPQQAEAINARAKAYQAKLAALHQELSAAFAAVPVAQRRVITGHDAFGYFGAAYGISFLAPVGLSTLDEPTAKDMAVLRAQAEKEGIRGIFIEALGGTRLVTQLADDLQLKIGGKLYPDALSGADGPAPDYVALMRHNAATILAALR